MLIVLISLGVRPADGAHDKAQLVRLQRVGWSPVGKDREGHGRQEEGQVRDRPRSCVMEKQLDNGLAGAASQLTSLVALYPLFAFLQYNIIQ